MTKRKMNKHQKTTLQDFYSTYMKIFQIMNMKMGNFANLFQCLSIKTKLSRLNKYKSSLIHNNAKEYHYILYLRSSFHKYFIKPLLTQQTIVACKWIGIGWIRIRNSCFVAILDAPFETPSDNGGYLQLKTKHLIYNELRSKRER